MKIYNYLSILLISFAPIYTEAKSGGPEASPKSRLESATKYLTDQPNLIAVYAKGLVCSSCAIGLRIHIKKLASVDQERFSKGVELDPERQLVVVAFKVGVVPEIDRIREAIFDAGYDPEHYFTWDGETVRKQTFTKK